MFLEVIFQPMLFAEAEEVADKVLEVRSADSFVMGLASDFHTNGGH